MCRADLIAAVMSKCEKDVESKAQITRIVDAVFDTITETVASGEKVIVTGFGTFESVERDARTMKTFDKVVNVPAKTVPKFSAGKAFKDAVNK